MIDYPTGARQETLSAGFVDCVSLYYAANRAQVRRDIMEGLINKMKGIYKDPNRVLFPKSGSSPPSGVGTHSTNGSIAASILLKKRLTLPLLAFLAALAVGLLFMLPGGPLHAQEAMTELDHAENSTDPVATFTCRRPGGNGQSTGPCWTPPMVSRTCRASPGDDRMWLHTDIADHGTATPVASASAWTASSTSRARPVYEVS